MASIASLTPPNIFSFQRNPISQNPIFTQFSLSFPLRYTPSCAIKTTSDGGQDTTAAYGGAADLLSKPVVSSDSENESDKDYSDIDDAKDSNSSSWVDWEDQILGDTVPLVCFVRMVLHSGKYGSGERLSPEHERAILTRLLPHHPEWQKKIGCGVDYITVGYHPNFESSRCLFIVRKDGELVDFSYWKCIKGLIRTRYPLYAENFILRHFRKRRHFD